LAVPALREDRPWLTHGSSRAKSAQEGSVMETPAPRDEDIRHDDLEFNVSLEPSSAKAWLNLLQEAEAVMEPWNLHCDKIDRLHASLERLSERGRDKEFQMFWANCEVMKPSIYAKPPVPVAAYWSRRLPEPTLFGA
jgi:hypothetical protein